MTRRELIATVAAVLPAASEPALKVPVLQVLNERANHTPEQLDLFSSDIWAQAVEEFQRCGIELQISQTTGDVGRTPGGMPRFKGLERGVINVVLTDRIPMAWDNGRGLAGLSTRHEGYHVCLIALSYAHGHQIPFVSVNTCVHEILHVLLEDIFVGPPRWWWPRAEREFRIDWLATRLWLFGDGAPIHHAAQGYLERLTGARLGRV